MRRIIASVAMVALLIGTVPSPGSKISDSRARSLGKSSFG